MPNLFWYILVSAIGLGIGFYTIYMKKDVYPISTLIVFFLFSTGISWIGEFTILGLFNSYEYKTGVFTDIWAQNILGHKLLNSTFYPGVALLTATFSLRYYGISFIAVSFALIEYLFVKLGAYEQHWWRYYMTSIAVVIYLLITKYWFAKMLRKPHKITRAITFYFPAIVIIDFLPSILPLLGKQHYQIGWVYNLFGNLYRTSTMILFTYHLIESFFLVLFICILKKWYWRVVPFFIPFIAELLFAKTNILILEDGWNLAYTIFIDEIFIVLFVLLEKYSLRPDTNKLYD